MSECVFNYGASCQSHLFSAARPRPLWNRGVTSLRVLAGDDSRNPRWSSILWVRLWTLLLLLHLDWIKNTLVRVFFVSPRACAATCARLHLMWRNARSQPTLRYRFNIRPPYRFSMVHLNGFNCYLWPQLNMYCVELELVCDAVDLKRNSVDLNVHICWDLLSTGWITWLTVFTDTHFSKQTGTAAAAAAAAWSLHRITGDVHVHTLCDAFCSL